MSVFNKNRLTQRSIRLRSNSSPNLALSCIMPNQIGNFLMYGFFSLVLSSCTAISIKNADSVKTLLYPGFVVIHVVEGHKNLAINSHGVGAYLAGEGASFGYFHDQQIYLNDLSKCITVFFNTGNEPLVCETK